MRALTIDRNAEGAWRVSAYVRDPKAARHSFFDVSEWLETRTYYGYSRTEAARLFRAYCRANGWQVTA